MAGGRWPGAELFDCLLNSQLAFCIPFLGKNREQRIALPACHWFSASVFRSGSCINIAASVFAGSLDALAGSRCLILRILQSRV